MTGYQISVLFGVPTALVAIAWLIVGLQRLVPRPRLDATPVSRSHVGEAAD